MGKKNKSGLVYKGHNKFACDGRDVAMPGLSEITDRQVYNAFVNHGNAEYIAYITSDKTLSEAIRGLGKNIRKAYKAGEQLTNSEMGMYIEMQNSKSKTLTGSMFMRHI